MTVLNNLVLRFRERASGMAMPSFLEQTTQITSKTWRKGTVSDKTLEKARQNCKESLKDRLTKQGHSNETADEFISQHPQFRNNGYLYSGLVYESQLAGGFEYPITMAYAEKIDRLSQELFTAWMAKDHRSFQSLLNGDLIGDLQLPILDELLGASIFSEKIPIDRASQIEMIPKLKVLTLFSLLALWDVEFGTCYFTKYTPRPLFELVLPKLNPAFESSSNEETLTVRRDMFWSPVRRFICLLSCLAEKLVTKRYPDSAPQVIDTVRLSREHEQNVKNWRDGTKKFTYQSLDTLWGGFCIQAGSNMENEQPPPLPIFIAAIFWELALVERDNKYKITKIGFPENDYLTTWKHHFTTFNDGKHEFGIREWPQCFSLI